MGRQADTQVGVHMAEKSTFQKKLSEEYNISLQTRGSSRNQSRIRIQAEGEKELASPQS